MHQSKNDISRRHNSTIPHGIEGAEAQEIAGEGVGRPARFDMKGRKEASTESSYYRWTMKLALLLEFLSVLQDHEGWLRTPKWRRWLMVYGGKRIRKMVLSRSPATDRWVKILHFSEMAINILN